MLRQQAAMNAARENISNGNEVQQDAGTTTPVNTPVGSEPASPERGNGVKASHQRNLRIGIPLANTADVLSECNQRLLRCIEIGNARTPNSITRGSSIASLDTPQTGRSTAVTDTTTSSSTLTSVGTPDVVQVPSIISFDDSQVNRQFPEVSDARRPDSVSVVPTKRKLFAETEVSAQQGEENADDREEQESVLSDAEVVESVSEVESPDILAQTQDEADTLTRTAATQQAPLDVRAWLAQVCQPRLVPTFDAVPHTAEITSACVVQSFATTQQDIVRKNMAWQHRQWAQQAHIRQQVQQTTLRYTQAQDTKIRGSAASPFRASMHYLYKQWSAMLGLPMSEAQFYMWLHSVVHFGAYNAKMVPVSMLLNPFNLAINNCIKGNTNNYIELLRQTRRTLGPSATSAFFRNVSWLVPFHIGQFMVNNEPRYQAVTAMMAGMVSAAVTTPSLVHAHHRQYEYTHDGLWEYMRKHSYRTWMRGATLSVPRAGLYDAITYGVTNYLRPSLMKQFGTENSDNILYVLMTTAIAASFSTLPALAITYPLNTVANLQRSSDPKQNPTLMDIINQIRQRASANSNLFGQVKMFYPAFLLTLIRMALGTTANLVCFTAATHVTQHTTEVAKRRIPSSIFSAPKAASSAAPEASATVTKTEAKMDVMDSRHQSLCLM